MALKTTPTGPPYAGIVKGRRFVFGSEVPTVIVFLTDPPEVPKGPPLNLEEKLDETTRKGSTDRNVSAKRRTRRRSH